MQFQGGYGQAELPVRRLRSESGTGAQSQLPLLSLLGSLLLHGLPHQPDSRHTQSHLQEMGLSQVTIADLELDIFSLIPLG